MSFSIRRTTRAVPPALRTEAARRCGDLQDDCDSKLGLHDYCIGVTLRTHKKTLWTTIDRRAPRCIIIPSSAPATDLPLDPSACYWFVLPFHEYKKII